MPAESSAYQICLQSPSSLLMSGMVATIHGHGQGVTLCGAFFRQNDVSINKKLHWTSVRVDKYGGNGWAVTPYVAMPPGG